jgi:sugar fermentation stimulation protein A
MQFFRADRMAVFEKRPNRFLVIARDGDERFRCHCPNQGRLTEFLFPGAPLILERMPPPRGAEGCGRKTEWRTVAAFRRGSVAPLYSVKANEAAEQMFLKRIIPGLAAVRREYTIGGSRFDFLCTDKAGRKHLVEVKACSLVEYGVAMFPDAPSDRALRHLEELAALSGDGWRCHLLFVIMHGRPAFFAPNLHTDPAFAKALCRLGYAARPGRWTHACGVNGEARPVAVHTALLRCNAKGAARAVSFRVPVDFSHCVLAAENRGSYLILLELPKDTLIATGALGKVAYEKGWYVYCGSARKNLASRVRRHLQKAGKTTHWHIDYLTPEARSIQGFPIMSYRNLECALAKGLAKIGGRPVNRFGSSDCSCASHLFYFADKPLENRAFVGLLFRFRHVEAFKPEKPARSPEG